MAGRYEAVSVGAVRCRWILASAAALLLAACSGDDPAPSATPTTSGSAVSTTTSSVVATTTSSPPTSAAPSTTPAETTVEPSPSTSELATTTTPEGIPPRVTFPDDPDKQAVVDAVYAYFDALNAAQAQPADPVLRAEVESTLAAPVLARVTAFLDGLVEKGEAFIDLGNQSSQLLIFEGVVSVVDEAALVDGCVVDRTSHVALGAIPDDDRVLDDEIVAALLSYSLVKTDTGWRVADLSVVERFEGSERCAD